MDSLARVEDLVAFVWFVLERGAPVFETLIAVLIVFSIVRYVAPETLSETAMARAQALSTLFPPSRAAGDEPGGSDPLLPEPNFGDDRDGGVFAGVGPSQGDGPRDRSPDATNFG